MSIYTRVVGQIEANMSEQELQASVERLNKELSNPDKGIKLNSYISTLEKESGVVIGLVTCKVTTQKALTEEELTKGILNSIESIGKGKLTAVIGNIDSGADELTHYKYEWNKESNEVNFKVLVGQY